MNNLLSPIYWKENEPITGCRLIDYRENFLSGSATFFVPFGLDPNVYDARMPPKKRKCEYCGRTAQSENSEQCKGCNAPL